jgi:hypothetical protein
MYRCDACLGRAVRSAISVLSSISHHGHSTFAGLQKGHHVRLFKEIAASPQRLKYIRDKPVKKPSVVQRRNDIARAANKHHLDIEPEPSAPEPQLSTVPSNRALQIELRWTGGDAVKLANVVLEKLKREDPSGALDIIRMSEKMPGPTPSQQGVDSVVSWNHVIDYFMHKRHPIQAFKVFNEV